MNHSDSPGKSLDAPRTHFPVGACYIVCASAMDWNIFRLGPPLTFGGGASLYLQSFIFGVEKAIT